MGNKTKTLAIVGAVILALLLVFGTYSFAAYKAEKVAELKVAEAKAAEQVKADAALKAATEAQAQALKTLEAAQEQRLEEFKTELQATLDEKGTTISEQEKAIADLQAQLESTTTTGQDSTVGEVVDKLYLGDAVTFNLDDGELASLLDGEIAFDGEKYDVQEKILNGPGFFVGYSAVDDEEFGANPYLLLTQRAGISYRYEFKDQINMLDISDEEPLEISFLGKNLEIVEASGNEITVRSGESFYLKEGQSVTVNGKVVTLEFVGDNDRAGIVVDGMLKVVSEFSSEEISGVDVRVEDILVNSRAGSAVLVIGDDVLVDLEDGDYFLTDGSEEYKFYIEHTGDLLDALVVTYDEKRTDLDDDYTALALGDELVFPYDFFAVKFDKILYNDYETVTVEFDSFGDRLKDGTDIPDTKGLLLSASGNIFEIGSDNTDEVYVLQSGKIYYEDNVGDWLEANLASLVISNDDFDATVSFVGTQLQVSTAYEAFTIDTKISDERLGTLEDESEPTDVVYGTKNVGDRDYDFMGASGLVIEDPDNNSDKDTVVFKLPSDRVELEVLVYTK